MFLGIALGALEQGLAFGLMALGVYLTFRVLDFPDLTVDGSFALGGACTAALLVAGWGPAAATAVAGIGGALAGTVTGLLHTRLHISGLLAGILTMTGLYSVNLRVMGRANVPLLQQQTLFTLVQNGWTAGFPSLLLLLPVVAAIALILVAFLRTQVGLVLRATGDNQQMVRSVGASTGGAQVLGLALANGLVALSGALVAQQQGFADVGMGVGTIVAGLASVIVGEAVLHPQGLAAQVAAVVGGSVLYRAAVALALQLGFAPTDLKLVTSLIVVVALATPALARLRPKEACPPGAARPAAGVGGEAK
ncbi:MAG: ABC transporter permease [Betaproteobacteria bacterium]